VILGRLGRFYVTLCSREKNASRIGQKKERDSQWDVCMGDKGELTAQKEIEHDAPE